VQISSSHNGVAGRKTDNATTVKGRLRAHFMMCLTAGGAMPLLLSTGSMAMDSDGESLGGSDMVPTSPGLLLLFVLPSPEI